MSTIGNDNFLIAAKSKKLIFLLTDLLEIIPKKHYYIKNKALFYAYDLLENIYIVNFSNLEFTIEKIYIKRDIALINFIISLLLDKKYISIKTSDKLLYVLTEINKMTNIWLSRMEDVKK